MLPMRTPQPQDPYAQAMDAIGRRKFDEALRHFRQVIQADPDHIDALYQMSRIYVAGDRSVRAIPHIRRAAGLRPAEPALWQVWAEAVALGGEEDDEAEYVAALKSAPIPAASKLPLQDRFGALRKASRPATGGLKPQAMKQMLTLMSAQKHPEAERMAQEALKRHPASAFAANVLASAQSAQKKTAAARANFQVAIRLDPKYAEAYENLGRMQLEDDKPSDASATLRKAVILAPGRASALMLFGEALTLQNEMRAALPVLTRAVREDPGSSLPQIALGNAYARLNNHDGAVAAFTAAVELAKGDVPLKIRAALGMAQSRIGMDNEALENLEKVLAVMPENPPALAGKASVLQTLGRFEEAQELFRRATELDPLNGDNYRQLIASHKTKPGDPILEKMLEIYDGAALPDTGRMNLAFAIAKAMEDIKENDRVFTYLNEANRLMRKSVPYRIAARDREVERTQTVLGDFDYRGARVAGTTAYAPIFVTGMPRSGTTLVEQIIASHSQVGGAGELSKATTLAVNLLFPKSGGRSLGDVPPAEIAALGHEYEAYLRGRIPDHERITDKSIPTYMHIGLLKLAMPNARFVVVRRDPRDNLFSIYKNKFPDGTHPYAYDLRDLALYYKTFVDMLDFWRARVPDWFYEVQYEDLVANPEDETRKLIAACDLPWEDACLSFHENTRKVQTLSVYQVRQPISQGSVKSWQRYEKELEPMISTLKEHGLVAD